MHSTKGFIRALLFLTLSTFVLFLASCTSPQTTIEVKTQTPVTLQLKWKHQFQFAGYYAAIEQGFYEEAGLDVTLLEAPENENGINPVLRGEADFGIAASDLVLERRFGHPVVALASIFQHSPLIFLTLETPEIISIHDLAGKRIMFEEHSEELIAYMESEGIPVQGYTRVPHSYDPQALIDQKVDAMSAYSTDEVFLLWENGVPYQTFSPRSGGIDFYGDTLFTTEAMIEEQPEVVEAFLEASREGWRYALENPEEIIDLIYTEYSQRHSRAHLAFEAEHTARLIMPDVVEIGYMNIGRWKHIARVYAEMGMINPDFDPSEMLYEPNSALNYTPMYISIAGIIILFAVISFVTLRFYRLNNQLKTEIASGKDREQVILGWEKKYRDMVELSPFPIVISNLDEGDVLYMNPKAAQKFHMAQGYAVGKDAHDLYVNPTERKKVINELRRQGYVDNAEVTLQNVREQPFWATLSASIIQYEGQEAAFFAIMDITQQKHLMAQLETLAMTDPLTGLANRRAFTKRLSQEINRSQRYSMSLSLILVDADHLKAVNDQYGHDAGDELIRKIAKTLEDNVREIDLTARLGGDEFGIILPNTTLDDAIHLGDRLRSMLATAEFAWKNNFLTATVSVGITGCPTCHVPLETLLKTADRALYQAKKNGRNRTVHISIPPTKES